MSFFCVCACAHGGCSFVKVTLFLIVHWGNYEVAILNTAQKVQEITTDGYCSAGCSTKKVILRDNGQCTLKSHVLYIHAFPCCCKRKKRAVFHFCLPDLTRGNSCYYDLNQSPTTKDSRKFVSQTSTLKL